MNISGEKEIEILDLVEMCCSFPKTTSLGAEANLLLETYIKKNLTQPSPNEKFVLDRFSYQKLIHHSCLYSQLDQILCLQFRV